MKKKTEKISRVLALANSFVEKDLEKKRKRG